MLVKSKEEKEDGGNGVLKGDNISVASKTILQFPHSETLRCAKCLSIQYCTKVGFKSRSGLNFFHFTNAKVVCITAMINHKFISFSAVQIYDHLHSSPSTSILRTHNVTSSQMA